MHSILFSCNLHLILFSSILLCYWFYSLLFFYRPAPWGGSQAPSLPTDSLPQARWMFPHLASGWRYFTGWTLRTPQLFSSQDEEGCCHAECLSYTLVWASRHRLLPIYPQLHHLWQYCIKRARLRDRPTGDTAARSAPHGSGDTWLTNVG